MLWILCTCYTDLNSIWVAPALLSILFQWARRVLSIRPDVVSMEKQPPWMIAVCAWAKCGKSQAFGCSMAMSRKQGALGEYLPEHLWPGIIAKEQTPEQPRQRFI
jgi:hypothetical protein